MSEISQWTYYIYQTQSLRQNLRLYLYIQMYYPHLKKEEFISLGGRHIIRIEILLKRYGTNEGLD